MNVTVVELSDKLLVRQLDNEGSKLFNDIISTCDISILLGEAVEYITANNDGVEKLNLKSGKVLEADLILYSVGVRPNLDIATSLGTNTNRAIVVDEYMKTNIDNVFACGDVAELSGAYYANWPAAIEMGKVAGANAAGENTSTFKAEKITEEINFSNLTLSPAALAPATLPISIAAGQLA